MPGTGLHASPVMDQIKKQKELRPSSRCNPIPSKTRHQASFSTRSPLKLNRRGLTVPGCHACCRRFDDTPVRGCWTGYPRQTRVCGIFSAGGIIMNIRAALRRHEKKLTKQLRKLEAELSGVRAATKALGYSAGREIIAVKKSAKKSAKTVRKISREGRLAISRAAKKRWAEWRVKKG